jgi:hypothetical protein
MFKILSTLLKKKLYIMQHLEGRGTPVLYIGRTVLKGQYFQILPIMKLFTEAYNASHHLVSASQLY